MAGMISVTTPKGERFSAYEAKPRTAAKGGILLIQEIFGINPNIRDLADGFAGEGYHVLAPDLFWRQELGVALSDQSEADWQHAFALLKGFDQDLGLADLQASLAHLRSLGANKVGAVGYCLGGRLAVMMALRTDVDAAVSYYGVELGSLAAEFDRLRTPLLLHIAELDEYLPLAERARVLGALGAISLAEAHVYEGRGHAFARRGGRHYHAEAAELANRRTRAFLEKTLVA